MELVTTGSQWDVGKGQSIQLLILQIALVTYTDELLRTNCHIAGLCPLLLPLVSTYAELYFRVNSIIQKIVLKSTYLASRMT